jgi:hypothetical protein
MLLRSDAFFSRLSDRAEQYYNVLLSYPEVVRSQLFGHLHADEFRLDRSCQLPPLLIASAVTPVYSNAPTFRVVTYDNSTFNLLDYEQFALAANGSWVRVYRASELYGSLNCSNLSAFARSAPLNAYASVHR